MTIPTARVVRRRAVTTGLVALCLFCTIMTAGLAGISGTPGWNVAAGAILNTAAAIALVWRYQAPWHVLAISVVGPLLFATDATAALVALFVIGVATRGRRLAFAIGVVYLACVVSLTYDAFRRRDYSMMTIGSKIDKAGPAPEWNLPLWLPWIIAAVLVVAVVGLGLLRKTKSELVDAVESRDRVAAHSTALREEMLLAEERARIARDMHDTLAAGLSRIALIAGGLQVNSGDGPERVSNTASLIHSTAHDSLEELKRIIGVLRGSDTGGVDAGRRSIAGIGDLVDGARSVGQAVRYVQEMAPGQVGPLSSHIAYRVVQESLTNAHKHSPNVPVQVTVSGAEVDGVTVEVRNHLVAQPSSTPGSGSGLTGLAEQVRSAGGAVSSGHVGAEFVVTAWLPWYS